MIFVYIFTLLVDLLHHNLGVFLFSFPIPPSSLFFFFFFHEGGELFFDDFLLEIPILHCMPYYCLLSFFVLHTHIHSCIQEKLRNPIDSVMISTD